MEQTLTVDPSTTNEAEIIAYNGAGRLATPPSHIPVDAWGPVLQERPRLFVLALGVDKYARPDWQLRYATKDATAFADAVKTVASAKAEGKALFADIEVKTLRDAEVTERAIAAAFDRLSQLEHATGRNTIAAAPAGKAAYEGYNGHGVLTYAILEALNRPDGAGPAGLRVRYRPAHQPAGAGDHPAHLRHPPAAALHTDR
jgi:uncharacterized caspase-like protein